MNYVIGDIQGNFNALKKLLSKIKFNSQTDYLYFLGDIVNRGDQSLAVLLFIKDLVEKRCASMVLGNHDYHLLVRGYINKKSHKKDTLDEILANVNASELLDFLRKQPLLIEVDNNLLVHAGIPPIWDEKILKCQVSIVEKRLQSRHNLVDFLHNSYQNISRFSNNSIEQNCYTINALMRMRFCAADGSLEFDHKGDQTTAPVGFKPWFDYPRMIQKNIIFGHWSTLIPFGQYCYPQGIYPLDRGCIWGRKLSAMRLDTKEIFTINCH